MITTRDYVSFSGNHFSGRYEWSCGDSRVKTAPPCAHRKFPCSCVQTLKKQLSK